MQDFEALFRRAWERSREPKLRWYILLNWTLLILLAAGFAAAAWGVYFALVEKKRAEQSIVEVNPELRRIFAPKRKLKFKEAEFSFGERKGDKLRKVVVRTRDRVIRAKSAELRLDADKQTVNLTLRRYRIYEAVDGEAVRMISEDDWNTLDLSYPFELPSDLRRPKKPVPGEIARGFLAVAGIVLLGVTIWSWLWQILSAGITREAAGERPTRMWRGFKSGFARWLTVMYPLPIITACGIVSFIGSLPNILQLPLAFYLAIYPLASALEITMLIFCGIMRIGVAVNPPESRFGDLLRESARVFLNGWGRYVVGLLWVYAFLALFVVMLAPGMVMLLNGVIFSSRVLLVSSVVAVSVWLVLFVAVGTRVIGCIAAYHAYLYADAAEEKPEPADGMRSPESKHEDGSGI